MLRQAVVVVLLLAAVNTVRRIFIVPVLLVLVILFTGWIHGTNVVLNQWLTLKMGGGGVADHLNVAADGTMAHCSDQVGAYIGSTTTPWVPITVFTKTPAAFTATGSQLQPNCEAMGLDPTHTNNAWMEMTADGGAGTTLNLYSTLDGGNTVAQNSSFPAVHWGYQGGSKNRNPLIAIDPNNSDVVYASTPSQGLYRTINGTSGGSATFSMIGDVGLGLPTDRPMSANLKNTDSTLVATCTGDVVFNNPAGGTNWGFTGGDVNYVVVFQTSAPVNAMFGTVHADTTTSFTLRVIANTGTCNHSDWSVSLQYNTLSLHNTVEGGGSITTFDPNSTTTVGGQTRSKNVYVCTFGVATFQSTDGGQTWTDITTGTAGENAKYCQEMKVGGDGTLYTMMDLHYSGQLAVQPIYYFNSATWTHPTGPSGTSAGWGETFDIDTINGNCATPATCHLIAFSSNYVAYTTTGPATANYHVINAVFPVQAGVGQPTWPVTYYNGGTFERDFSSARFVPGGNVYVGFEGVFFVTPQTAGTSMSLNVWTAGEEMSENTAIEFNQTVSGAPIVSVWDFGGFYKSPLASYPSDLIGSTPYTNELHHIYSISFAPGTNTVAALADTQTGTYKSFSAISTSGGQPGTWTLFATDPKATACGGNPCKGGAICMSTPSNILVMPSDSVLGGGGTVKPRFTVDGGTTWADVTLSGVTPTGGWPFSIANIQKPCAPDPNNPGKYYLYNWNTGASSGHPGDAILTCTTSGSTMTCAWTSHPNFSAVATTQFAPQLKVTSNGDLWFTAGSQAANVQPRSVPMRYSMDGGATWPAAGANGTLNVVTFGFGVSFPGKTYDTLAFVGWYTGTALVNGVSQSLTSQYGSYMCKQFNTGTGNCDTTWQLMGPDFFFGSGGWASVMVSMDGDKFVPGLFGVVSQFGGGFYGQFNYLLKRDFNPADNDNSPAFLNKVG